MKRRLRQANAQFRRRTLVVVERRMLRQLVSLATRWLLLRVTDLDNGGHYQQYEITESGYAFPIAQGVGYRLALMCRG